ncbi:MAG TPA: hypothetical protein V6D19_08485 [Stenomitos sp.]
MKILLSFFIISLAIVGAATVSVQNAGLTSIQIGQWQSIGFPLGLLLSLCFSFGLLLSVLIVLGWRLTSIYSDADEVSFADGRFLEKDIGEDWH